MSWLKVFSIIFSKKKNIFDFYYLIFYIKIKVLYFMRCVCKDEDYGFGELKWNWEKM